MIFLRIGVYGGTFNPPHIGHVSAAIEALRELKLDRLFVIPAAIPPHKELGEDAAGPEQRLELARLAFAGCGPNTEVLDMEIRRGGRSYTADTLDELKKRYPGAELFLLMGTDMFLSLESWARFGDIISAVDIGVFSRAGGDNRDIEAAAARFRVQYGANVTIIDNKAVTVSSSQVRERLRGRAGGEYLDDRVYEYIIKNRLYGAKPEFDWLRVKAYAMLNLKRIPHVAGCERESVSLARRWGADEDAAREAAILHDCTKRLGLEEQLILCRKYGIMTDIVETGEAKLLHSKTGAAIAKYEFGLGDEVFDAIFWHTTGKADMTLLEKVIYMGDYIELTRSFEGLEELRRLAYEDMDAAMLLGLKMSIEDMKARGIDPHKNSREAMEWLGGRIAPAE